MVVGEDKNKVANIVEAQIDLFRDLYINRLKTMSEFVDISEGVVSQDCSERGRYFHMLMLPKHLQESLVNLSKKDGDTRDVEEILLSAARDPHRSTAMIQKSIGNIVQQSSTPQAVKGLITAGPYKAVQYSFAKLKKMFKSM